MERASLTVLLMALCPVVAASQCEPDPAAETAPSVVSSKTGVSETEAPPAVDRVGSSTSGKRDLLIAELTSRLDRAQTAGRDEQVATGGGVALEPLLGMARSELRAALGAPHTCEETSATGADGHRVPVAPCQTKDDWFYSFYHRPEGWNGGGPELLLQFDQKGNCVSARWVLTQ